MGKINLYSLNFHNTLPALVDELYNIVIGGNASMNSLTLTGTTASTSSTVGILKSAGGISISNSTEASSSSNGGTLTTAGGAGIAKKLYVGGEIIGESTTNATSNSSGGGLTLSGGIAIAQDMYIGGDIYVSGTINGLSFVPLVTDGTYTNISSLSTVGLSSVRTGTSINFACVCIVTPTSATPQDTSFRLTISPGSYPPSTFLVPYALSPATSGWANTSANPISVENCVTLGVVGTTSFFIKFTNYDANPHYITIKIAYTHAGP